MQTGRYCDIHLEELTRKIPGPVYIYYQMDAFYQNHRRYVKSRENDQLAGKYLLPSELSRCDPVITVGDLWQNQRYSFSGIRLPNESPAIPCGLVAKSFFNDTFRLSRIESDGSRKSMSIVETGIAWASDVDTRFKNI